MSILRGCNIPTGDIMKKVLLTILIACISIALIALSFYFVPRLFGSDEIKAMYQVKDIMYSHISVSSDDPLDFVRDTFESGTYEYKDEKLCLSLAMNTDADIIEALSELPTMQSDIDCLIENNELLSDANTELVIRIENWSGWVLNFEPKKNYLSIGVGEQNSLTEILEHCKQFESIQIGGYWGYNVSVADDINSDFFADFTVLKALDISDIETVEMKKTLDDALASLRDRGVNITIEVTSTPTPQLQ